MTQTDAGRRAAEIARLNDQFRSNWSGGQIVITLGIQTLSPEQIREVVEAVWQFSDFTPDNDPHGEHDCAVITAGGERIIWKIDYYDRALKYGSPDPADPAVTTRVLTIMLASEY